MQCDSGNAAYSLERKWLRVITLALGVMISGNATDDVLSGNAADDGMLFAFEPHNRRDLPSHMLSGNAAPPRPLTITSGNTAWDGNCPEMAVCVSANAVAVYS